jgi:hypothetical protein
MYKKIESLQRIKQLGLNLHNFFIPESFKEFLNLAFKLRHFTIRTDAEYISQDLPFFIVNIEEIDMVHSHLLDIWNKIKDKDCKAILSDGIKHDKVQVYNMCINLQKNGDFILEASHLKIPLRKMYAFPNDLLSCVGNICESPIHWLYENKTYMINRYNLWKDIVNLYANYNEILFNNWAEITKYPKNVGIQNKDIVFWQL